MPRWDGHKEASPVCKDAGLRGILIAPALYSESGGLLLPGPMAYWTIEFLRL